MHHRNPTSPMMTKNPFQTNKSTKRKDRILHSVIAIQAFAIILLLRHQGSINSSASSNSDFLRSKDDGFNKHPFYEYPKIYPEKSQIARVWHSNGSPFINNDLKQGSCWCSGDDYCMCTPSIAIDTILLGGDDHFWLVKRKDTGKYATMGGFVEVGETSEDAVRRELMEEMNVDLGDDVSSSKRIQLFGIYGDPIRDPRRHTVSVVYIVDIPSDAVPKAGDDAAEVLRVRFDEIDNMSFFADHKTILKDYIQKTKQGNANGARTNKHPPIRRSLCSK